MNRIRHELTIAGKDSQYQAVVDVLRELHQGFTTEDEAVTFVSRVLRPYPHLALDIPALFPSLDQSSHPIKITERAQISALQYIRSVRATDRELATPLCRWLNLWQSGRMGLGEMYGKIEALFVSHPDLLDAFQEFLSPADREILLGVTTSSNSYSSDEEDDIPSLTFSSPSSSSQASRSSCPSSPSPVEDDTQKQNHLPFTFVTISIGQVDDEEAIENRGIQSSALSASTKPLARSAARLSPPPPAKRRRVQSSTSQGENDSRVLM